ncbi:MAG: DUF3830 family protein [Acidobacteriota bacterium]
MADVVLMAGDVRLEARFETRAAPKTCAALRALLPFASQIVHVRWSGEAVWVPMGDMHLDLPPENATSYPSPGQVLLYPGGISETEILIAYGATHFASKAGTLAGNHVLTITAGTEHLRSIGERALWHGAQTLKIDLL